MKSMHLISLTQVMGGPGRVVQIEETAFGHKHKYNRGHIRGSSVKWIFGILDVTTHKCHIQLVQKRDRDTLFPIILRYVRSRMEIHSDETSVYLFHHKTVKHKDNYVNPLGGIHTNNIENFCSHIKNKFRDMHGVKNDNLALHLDKFTYRWNTKERNMFDQFLHGIAEQ